MDNLGIKGVTLNLNTLGDRESRQKYCKVLENHLNTYKDRLSEETRTRLERGSVLRILDSKNQRDIETLTLSCAPTIVDALNERSLEYWKGLTSSLNSLGVRFVHNANLVRGLDYYEDTVFEFVCDSDNLGRSQGTVLAGGRYDGMVKDFCKDFGVSADVSGAGWSLGVDRVSLVTLQEDKKEEKKVCVVSTLSSAQVWYAVQVTNSLKLNAQLLVGQEFGKLTKKADQRNVDVVVFVGPEEFKESKVSVKSMKTGKQIKCDFANVQSCLENLFGT